MPRPEKKPSFSPTVRDALLFFRMLQLGFCTREQMQRHIFGEGESANASMSRRWSAMSKRDYIKEKNGLFYPTALGLREVLMPMLAEHPGDLAMIDGNRLPRPPNPGSAQLTVDHHRWTAETVLHFVECYESLPLVTRCYALRGQKLGGGRILPDSVLMLLYEGACSVFMLEIEVSNTREDFTRKVRQYVRYHRSGGFPKDYQDHFQPGYDLPALTNPLFRVMVVCANARRMDGMIEAARSVTDGDTEAAVPDGDLFRFTVSDELVHGGAPRPIWIRPGDRGEGRTQKRWEVE